LLPEVLGIEAGEEPIGTLEHRGGEDVRRDVLVDLQSGVSRFPGLTRSVRLAAKTVALLRALRRAAALIAVGITGCRAWCRHELAVLA
jgi:hypothetical protein